MNEFKVYRATNTYNNKTYIGSTKRALRDRINSHYTLARYTHKQCKSMSKFLTALLEFQKGFFTWEILEYAETREEVVALENKYIDIYDSIDKGYNTSRAYICNNGINRSDIQDKRIFEFINTETNEKFTGTQSELISKYHLYQPAVNAVCNSKVGKRSHRNWTIIGKERKHTKSTLKNKIVHLYNLDTDEEFTGNYVEFTDKYNVSIIPLLYKYKDLPVNNWCYYEDRNTFMKIVKKFRKIKY